MKNTNTYAPLCTHTPSVNDNSLEITNSFAYEIDIVRIPLQVMDSTAITSPKESAEYLYGLGIAEHPQEHFVILHLDTRNNTLGHSIVSKGLVDRSHVHPREVFRSAIINGTSKLILAHNHPSGEVSPSRQDITTTENLIDVGKVIGIPVIDHIIVGFCRKNNFRRFTSMRTEDLLSFEVS